MKSQPNHKRQGRFVNHQKQVEESHQPCYFACPTNKLEGDCPTAEVLDKYYLSDQYKSRMDIRLFTVESPEYKEMVELRLNVLLHPIGAPASYINPEKERSDFLVGAFDQGILIGCCVLTPRDEALIQLRQMAVRPDFQGKGVGAAIVAFAEQTAREKGFKRLMMHARDVVIPFYEKSGYTIASEQFTEVGVEHHRMEKELL